MSPIFMKQLFAQKSISYDLRDDNVLDIPRYNTVMYGFTSLRYQGTGLWKILDCSVKNSILVNEFKKKIDKWGCPICYCMLMFAM